VDKSVDVLGGGIDVLSAVVVKAGTVVVEAGTVVVEAGTVDVVAGGSVAQSTLRTARKTRITAADLASRRDSFWNISNNNRR